MGEEKEGEEGGGEVSFTTHLRSTALYLPATSTLCKQTSFSMNNVSCNPDESFAQTKTSNLNTGPRGVLTNVCTSAYPSRGLLSNQLSLYPVGIQTYGVARVYSCTGWQLCSFLRRGKKQEKRKGGKKELKVVSSEKRRQVQRPRIFRCLEMTSPRRRRERERKRERWWLSTARRWPRTRGSREQILFVDTAFGRRED